MFQNNPSLRAAGEHHEYTPEQISEWIRCKEDILYFAEKYFYIISIDHGRILIPLREYQKRMLKAYCSSEQDRRHNIVLSGRQSGKCVTADTKIKVRNKNTGEIIETTMKDFRSKIV